MIFLLVCPAGHPRTEPRSMEVGHLSLKICKKCRLWHWLVLGIPRNDLLVIRGFLEALALSSTPAQCLFMAQAETTSGASQQMIPIHYCWSYSYGPHKQKWLQVCSAWWSKTWRTCLTCNWEPHSRLSHNPAKFQTFLKSLFRTTMLHMGTKTHTVRDIKKTNAKQKKTLLNSFKQATAKSNSKVSRHQHKIFASKSQAAWKK